MRLPRPSGCRTPCAQGNHGHRFQQPPPGSQACCRMNRRRPGIGAHHRTRQVRGLARIPPRRAPVIPNDVAMPLRGTLSSFGTAPASIGTASSSSAETAFPSLNHDSIDAGDAFVARNDEFVPWHSDVVVPNILRFLPERRRRRSEERRHPPAQRRRCSEQRLCCMTPLHHFSERRWCSGDRLI
jgi:hypothetical protein